MVWVMASAESSPRTQSTSHTADSESVPLTGHLITTKVLELVACSG